jgi:hypothetical protein
MCYDVPIGGPGGIRPPSRMVESRSPMSKKEDPSAVSDAILKLVSSIPSSSEPTAADPKARSQRLATTAARKAAAISAGMALPPGPIGMLTIIPDLLAIWKIQRQLVADIARVYDKTAALTRESMLWCLFKHGAAALLRDVVVRVGERFVIKRATLRLFQQLLAKISVRITQRVLGRTISRWVPLIGALSVGAYAYYDTSQVAASAIELFSNNPEAET